MQLQTGQDWTLWLAFLAMVTGGAAWAVVSRQETNPDQVWSRGEADFRAGHYDRTEAALKQLERLRKPKPLDWMLRAQLDLARQRVDDGLTDLAHVPDADPIAPQARLLQGQVELRRNRVRKAEEAFRAALALDPKLIKAHRELIYIYGIQLRRRLLHAEFRALSELTPLTYENVWHWCLTRNSIWEPVELRGLLGKYLKADPDDRESRLALADCLCQLQQFDEAETTLAPLPESDPDARAVRARLALERGNDREAEKILAGGPSDHPVLARLRGRFALAHQRGEEALRNFRAAYAAEPDNRDTLAGLASALIVLGKDAEAQPYLIAARNQDILGTLMQRVAAREGLNDLKLHAELGAACEAIGRYPEARAWYKLVIARDPFNTDAQQALFRLDDEIAKTTATPP